MTVNIRKSRVLTEEKILEIQSYYAKDKSLSEISKLTGIKLDTIKKGIKRGRIKLISKQDIEQHKGLNKSERSVIDNTQAMGKACMNVVERVLSSKTGSTCLPRFREQYDLQQAGVLLSLPALLSHGLLKYEKEFYPDYGYYSISSVFLCLAFLSLLRIKTLEQSSSIPSGELGKAIGLDRIPEVKTLRERIALFCQRTDINNWARNLSNDWMQEFPELSGVLYVDGHVNVYFGRGTKMPRRYVSRLRLCMSGSTDYWVNDKLGQPYFVVNKVINSGMMEVVKNDILPRLKVDVPNQPSEEELEQNPLLSRFMLVFDRECYSPDFFYELWQERISVCTYNKNVKDLWDTTEFSTYTEVLETGEKTQMELAERGVLLQSKGSNKKIWAREIRKKTATGHQTSIITTNYLLPLTLIGLYMFARWSQENFFKYMIENFGIDTLVSYARQKMSDTSILVNPLYRELETLQKKLTSKLNVLKAKFATLVLNETLAETKQIQQYLEKKATMQTDIEHLEKQVAEIKEKKKQTPRKIRFEDLPENKKFDSVINQRKLFLDTIKIIAYRAETAMANIIKPLMHNNDKARTLLKQIYMTDANIFPDYENNKLIVELHRMTYWKDDKIVEQLCNLLNETETIFPNTNLVIYYKLVSS